MLWLLFLACIFQIPHRIIPVPIENALTNFNIDRPTYTDRSIWQVIWSCLATIFVCTWVSVHPNIPGPKDSDWKIAMRRLRLMCWAIMAPELVIYWAVRQWTGARKIAKMYRGYGWTKAHGYFLQMGGFMLFKQDGEKEVLSCATFRDYYVQGRFHFPTITEAEIRDRSKGDGLSKTITICQTTWFSIQCVARRDQGLVVTKLELVTVAFATLNAVMYFFWWDKPLDVRCSVPVYMLQPPWERKDLDDSEITGESDPSLFERVKAFPGQILAVRINPFRPTSTCRQQSPYPPDGETGIFRRQNRDVKLVLLDCLLSIPVTIWGLVKEVYEFQNCEDVPERAVRVPTLYAYVRGGQRSDALAAFLGLLFGAINLTAWFSPFPSYTELILWRVCSLIVALTPVTMYISTIIGKAVGSNPSGVYGRVVGLTTLGILLLFLLVYPFARLALITLAFTTLRSLPQDALVEPDWASKLPHI